jgi:hypothetical protein
LVEMTIPASVEVLGWNCFSDCKALFRVTFESGSRLSRIERRAFYQSSLVEVLIPASVEVLGEECFYECRYLSCVAFKTGSKLREVGRRAFFGIPVSPISPAMKYCVCA